jgi:hypothetical protein
LCAHNARPDTGPGAAEAMIETFDQLDELLVALGESSGQ